MREEFLAALAGAVIMFGGRQLWELSKALLIARAGTVEESIDRQTQKIHSADIRFAEIQGVLNALEFRFAILNNHVSAIEKLRTDVNAAHEKIRLLERERARAIAATS